MAEHRPFPPSARRRSLAQRAGLHAASPLATAAVAAAAAVLATSALASSAAARLGASLSVACRAADTSLSAAAASSSLLPPSVPDAVLSLALPLLAAVALAAAAAHLAQTRAPWLPRRRIPGAPALPHGAADRTRHTAFSVAAAAVIGATAFGFLWLAAPRLAALPSVPLAGAALLASAVATLAIAWLLLGVLDSLLRHAALAQALRMSPHEKREDDRLAGLDPRWRAYRARARRPAPTASIAGATVLLLGDDAAVAIAWDAARRPIPTRVAAGRAARATQLLGLARRHRIPVHRDASLTAALASSDGPVPGSHWPRLAEIIAALRHP